MFSCGQCLKYKFRSAGIGYLLIAKQGYTVREMEKDKQVYYILISAGMKFRNKKKFRHNIPAYTGPFRACFWRNEYFRIICN
jgi:hypothetical protein